MQDKGATTDPIIDSGPRIPYITTDYFLQTYDIVDINIKTTSPELNDLFEITGGGGDAGAGMMMGQNGGDVFFMNGFSLDENGNVELPLIGEVHLLGLTVKQAKELIESMVSMYVNENEYFVRVRLGGIRFSALGEFNMPGKHTILQNRASILEAVAMAGDMNIIAKRDEVVIVRQYPDGSQIHRIDLNDKNLLASEFYFIRPNDVIYAEPLRVREVGSGTNLLQTLTLVTTMLTTGVLVYSIVNNQ